MRALASILLLAGCSAWDAAAGPTRLRFAVDVTEVQDADGLVHALGWPVVAGDRLDGEIITEGPVARATRARLRLTCGRMDFEHVALRFSFEGDGPSAAAIHWLGGVTRRVHGGRAIRVLVSLHPSGDGGHTLRIELNSLEDSEEDLHDAIRGTVGPIEVLPGAGGLPWIPLLAGGAAALVASAAGVAAVRRRRERAREDAGAPAA